MRYSYEQIGMAGLLPGLTRAAEVLQGEIDNLQKSLGNSKKRKSASQVWWDHATPAMRKKRLAQMLAGRREVKK
jgi:hypothetical protein